jgi:hypothetical protein
MSESQKVLLVVLERGGAWPSCVEECRLRTTETVVLAQGERESPSELATRACRRLARLSETGKGVEGAAIATGDANDHDLAASRCTISQAILRGMREATDSGKQLWLVASERASRGKQHDLLALAGELTSEFVDPELSISVTFGGPARAADKPELGELRRHGRTRARS